MVSSSVLTRPSEETVNSGMHYGTGQIPPTHEISMHLHSRWSRKAYPTSRICSSEIWSKNVLATMSGVSSPMIRPLTNVTIQCCLKKYKPERPRTVVQFITPQSCGFSQRHRREWL